METPSEFLYGLNRFSQLFCLFNPAAMFIFKMKMSPSVFNQVPLFQISWSTQFKLVGTNLKNSPNVFNKHICFKSVRAPGCNQLTFFLHKSLLDPYQTQNVWVQQAVKIIEIFFSKQTKINKRKRRLVCTHFFVYFPCSHVVQFFSSHVCKRYPIYKKVTSTMLERKWNFLFILNLNL